MRTHRLPESQGSAAVPAVKPTFDTLLEPARAARPRPFNIVALSLEWVGRDPSNDREVAAAMFVTAHTLCTDERTARWLVAHSPKLGVFNWKALQPLIHQERRRAKFGPGWARAAKGQDVDFDDSHAAEAPDPEAVIDARDMLDHLQRVLTNAQWAVVERLKAGQKLTNAEHNALYHLRRRVKQLGLKASWLAS